jgi:threonyl-tRNA synthetase
MSAAPEKDKKLPAEQKEKKKKPVAVQQQKLPEPAYFAHRITIYDRLKAEQDKLLASKPREQIQISLPDGKVQVGTSWETTPASIAKAISKSLLDRTVISKVNGELWDLERPLEKDSKIELLDFTNEEAKKVYWRTLRFCSPFKSSTSD